MSHFTKYSENKFDYLNKHKVFITKEQVEDAINLPDRAKKKGKLFFARKDGVETVYSREDGVIKIITFYPVK